jgi:hypothetical protein
VNSGSTLGFQQMPFHGIWDGRADHVSKGLPGIVCEPCFRSRAGQKISACPTAGTACKRYAVFRDLCGGCALSFRLARHSGTVDIEGQ